MKPNRIMTIMLGLFVAVTVLYAEQPGAEPDAAKEAASRAVQSEETQWVEKQASRAPGKKAGNHQIIAYYFHGNQRCRTCRTIEAYAAEAVQNGFADEIKGGRLEWQVVNTDKPENEHYVGDFQLVTRSLVLQEKVKGVQERWKNLPRIWELVRNKEAFQKYVQEETRAFLEGRDQ